jgi:hypothetical protein
MELAPRWLNTKLKSEELSSERRYETCFKASIAQTKQTSLL